MVKLSEGQPVRAGRMAVLLIVCAFVLQLAFFTPLQALAQNFGEFSVRFIDVLLVFLTASLVLIVVLFLFLRRRSSPLWLAGLTLLSVIGFLESRFFLGLADLGPFDGKPIEWEVLHRLSAVEISMIAALVIVFVLIRRHTQVLSSIALFILLFLSAGFAWQMNFYYDSLVTPTHADAESPQYLDHFYRLSEERNVLHIVPDQAQGAMLHDILKTDYDHFASVFDGFTLFTQAVARFQATYPSVVYYMTGEAPEPLADIVPDQPFTRDFIAETLEQKSIVKLLAENGFNAFGFQFYPGIFCKGPYTACTGTHDEVFAGVAVNTPRRRLLFTVLTGLDIGLFQLSPLALRQQIYAGGQWFTRRLMTRDVTHSGVLDIFTDKVQAGDYPDSYNYIHHAGPHAPLLFDRNCEPVGPQSVNFHNQSEQARCTLKQLEKMIAAVKKAGAYDQTMIVINGDHGTAWLPESQQRQASDDGIERLMAMASTLVLIKPPHARGDLAFSRQAVDIGDIPATIASVLGLDHDYAGVRMFSDTIPDDRPREFYTYDSASKAHALQSLVNLRRHRIRGDVFDERDWTMPDEEDIAQEWMMEAAREAEIGQYPSSLTMDHPQFGQLTEGFSYLEQQSLPVRWVDGDRAMVRLSPPGAGPAVLVFECLVPETIDGQAMVISLGGEVVATLGEDELREHRHIVPLPGEWRAEDRIELEFKMTKVRQPKGDPRQLSVMFWSVALEPADH
jgi:hypothetical protein